MQKQFISIKDWGVVLGYGLFETLRIYEDRPFLLEEHIERLMNSSRKLLFLDMPDEKALKKSVYDYIKAKNLKREALRLSITYGNETEKISPQVFITHRSVPYGESDYEKGIAVVVSSYRKNEHSPIVPHKTFNQLENVLSLKLIKKHDVKECIFLNTAGYIAEGSKSNIFFVREGSVFTPSIECGILPGITRGKVMELLKQQGIQVQEGRYTLEELTNCDECFCTNSLMEVIPIVKLNETSIGNGNPGELTRLALSLYRRCIKIGNLQFYKKRVVPATQDAAQPAEKSRDGKKVCFFARFYRVLVKKGGGR